VLRRFQSLHQNSIFGYLKSVAASVVCDYFKFERAQKRDVMQTDAISDNVSFELRSTGRANPDALENRVVLQQIDEAIYKLFPGENFIRNRTIFWLHNREGMTASAIASIPSIGLNTKGVESTLRRMTQVIQSHIGSTL
jgi:DNA-directed RNA polymerase specialized sigma24 family protein